MSGKPAKIRQRDCKSIIEAAKQAGCPKIEFRIGSDAWVILNLRDEAPVDQVSPNNSFDKILAPTP